MAGGLGEFEQIVLLTILRLGEEAYGVSIKHEITKRTQRNPTPGALYTTLDRLEAKGFIQARLGDPTPERGGRAKRFFKLTPAGLEAVAVTQRAYRSLLEGIVLPEAAHG